jgi:transcriptional regulator with XRE-family HTH domain
MLTGKQIRAARALTGWEAQALAKQAHLSATTILQIERGVFRPRPQTIEKITRAFNGAGVEFTDNEGVRRMPHDIQTFQGPERFAQFYDFVYNHLNKNGGDVCIGGSDAKLYTKYRANPELHRRRMAELAKRRKDLNVRILCKEGDYNFVATSYAHYRWQPESYFSPTTFYTFGNYLALISFSHDPAPHVLLIDSAPYADAYRKAFNLAWENAKQPPPRKAGSR